MQISNVLVQQRLQLSHEDAIKEQAVKLETLFISEMLKHAGLGDARDSFGGGVGEAQYTSLLRDLQANEVGKSGGFGLAEHLFEALKARVND